MAKSNSHNKEVYERDNYRCRYCSKKNNLNCHHIVYRSAHGKKTKEEQELLRNKIIVCIECHEKIHRKELFVVYFKKNPDRPVVINKTKLERKKDLITEDSQV